MKGPLRMLMFMIMLTWIVVVGFALFVVRDHLTVFAYMIIGSMTFASLSCGLALQVLVWRRALKVDWHDKGPVGSVATWGHKIVGDFSVTQSTTPMAVLPQDDPVDEQTTKMVLTPRVPSADELLVGGKLGSEGLLLGFDTYYEPVYEEFGRQRAVMVLGETQSGKTGTLFWDTVQLLLLGYCVTVCDPNYTKPRSLINLLRPLEEFIQLQTDFDGVVTSIDFHYDELQRRKVGDVVKRPSALVIDEWTEYAVSRFSSDIVKKLQVISQQGAGYQLVLRLAAQLAQSEFVGGTALRGSVPDCIVHRVAPLESKKLLPMPKDHNLTGSLSTGHALFKSNGHVSKLIVPHADIHFAQLAKAALIKRRTA